MLKPIFGREFDKYDYKSHYDASTHITKQCKKWTGYQKAEQYQSGLIDIILIVIEGTNVAYFPLHTI